MSAIDLTHLYDEAYFESAVRTSCLLGEPPSLRHLSKGYVLPPKRLVTNAWARGGVLDRDGSFVESSSLDSSVPVTMYDFSQGDVDRVRGRAVYLGVFLGIWGHCITDNLSKLWFVIDDVLNSELSDCDLLYFPDHRGLPQSFWEMLQVLGVDRGRMKPIRKVLQYDELIVPGDCFRIDSACPVGIARETSGACRRVFTQEYVDIVDIIRRCASSSRESLDEVSLPEKVFFTTSRLGRVSFGSKVLDDYLASQGYRVISPEDLSFYEQLEILQNCKWFASTVGSCSHNTVFLRSRTNVILIPRAYYLMGYQEALNQVSDLRISYADSSLSLYMSRERPWEGPFCYCVSRNLANCLSDRASSVDEYRSWCIQEANRYRAFVHDHPGIWKLSDSLAYRDAVADYLGIEGRLLKGNV